MQKAFEWYEHKRVGLGYEIIEEIEDRFEKICKHPHHYSATDQKYRKTRIDRFPYIIVFEIADAKIIIIALKHIRQDQKH